MKLTQKKCEPCEGGIGTLPDAEIAKLLADLKGWQRPGDTIEKRWKFNNFVEAQAFVNAIGSLAEEEGHHPDISFGWGYVVVNLSTHAVKGLTLNDFILAAKIDALPLNP